MATLSVNLFNPMCSYSFICIAGDFSERGSITAADFLNNDSVTPADYLKRHIKVMKMNKTDANNQKTNNSADSQNQVTKKSADFLQCDAVQTANEYCDYDVIKPADISDYDITKSSSATSPDFRIGWKKGMYENLVLIFRCKVTLQQVIVIIIVCSFIHLSKVIPV